MNKPIYEITLEDGINYLKNNLDIRRVSKGKNKGNYLEISSKETIRANLTSFFYYVMGVRLQKGEIFVNPIPNRRVFKFTIRDEDIEDPTDTEDEETFTDDELLEVLKITQYKKKGMRDFIMFSLLICCGMRISECITIQIRHINLEERWLTTGYLKGSRKSVNNRKKRK